MISNPVAMLKTEPLYEARPWACIGFGALGLFAAPHSAISLASGVVLLICGATMLRWRSAYRRAGGPRRVSIR